MDNKLISLVHKGCGISLKPPPYYNQEIKVKTKVYKTKGYAVEIE